MNSETQARDASSEVKPVKRTISGEVVTGFAVLGCLAAGTIGLAKALTAEGFGAGVCVLASTAAFGTVCYVYFRKA